MVINESNLIQDEVPLIVEKESNSQTALFGKLMVVAASLIISCFINISILSIGYLIAAFIYLWIIPPKFLTIIFIVYSFALIIIKIMVLQPFFSFNIPDVFSVLGIILKGGSAKLIALSFFSDIISITALTLSTCCVKSGYLGKNNSKTTNKATACCWLTMTFMFLSTLFGSSFGHLVIYGILLFANNLYSYFFNWAFFIGF